MEIKTLYGLDKSGGIKQWSIWTNGAELSIEHGKVGGKLQLKRETVEGKNIGRANETTPEQQAELEAMSRYRKQIDKGYRVNKEDLTELPLLPMLAHDYLKQGHRIKYPCYGSAKLDGVRCLAIADQDGVTLKSRGGKEYNVAHIKEQLESIMIPGEVWDGELYIHGKYLEEIVSAVKKPNENTPNLDFIVFDMVTSAQFEDRLNGILLCSIGTDIPNIHSIEYVVIDNEHQMKDWHKRFVSEGFEGIMLRNKEGSYESGKRSADLQKYKEFFDEEFEIVAVGKDKNDNAVLCVFDTTAQETFTVCYGDFEERKNQLENWESYIGKKLTVKYQTRYKDSKLPQFPVGVTIRDYE